MKYFCSIFIYLLSIVNMNAQVLWKVFNNNTNGVSYLLGSHHNCDGNFCDSIPGFKTALDNVSVVYGELAASEVASADNLRLMKEYMMLPNGIKLSELFSPSERICINEKLEAIFNKPISYFDVMKPATLAVYIQDAVRAMSYGVPQKSMDDFVRESAERKMKTTKGLETIEAQLDMLYGLSLEEQAQDLLELIKNANLQSGAIKMLDAYKSLDLDHIWKLYKNDQSKKEYNRTIKQRNINWMPTIESAIQAEPSLFVVGVGHLPGKYGLVNMLRKVGYTVVPVTE